MSGLRKLVEEYLWGSLPNTKFDGETVQALLHFLRWTERTPYLDRAHDEEVAKSL